MLMKNDPLKPARELRSKIVINLSGFLCQLGFFRLYYYVYLTPYDQLSVNLSVYSSGPP